jgi:hypothetical protein
VAASRSHGGAGPERGAVQLTPAQQGMHGKTSTHPARTQIAACLRHERAVDGDRHRRRRVLREAVAGGTVPARNAASRQISKPLAHGPMGQAAVRRAMLCRAYKPWGARGPRASRPQGRERVERARASTHRRGRPHLEAQPVHEAEHLFVRVSLHMRTRPQRLDARAPCPAVWGAAVRRMQRYSSTRGAALLAVAPARKAAVQRPPGSEANPTCAPSSFLPSGPQACGPPGCGPAPLLGGGRRGFRFLLV